MYLGDLCWQEAEKFFNSPSSVMLIPIGSTEQHGCVGPLGTDWMIPEEFCRRLSTMENVIVAPPLCYGVAPQHTQYTGSVDIGLQTMSQIVDCMLSNWFSQGLKRFVIINGHGGNTPAFTAPGLKLYRQGGLLSVINWWSIAPQLNPNWVTGHGDAQEVSAILAFRPELIKKEYLCENRISHLTEQLIPIHLNTVSFEGAQVQIIREIKDTASNGGFGGLSSQNASENWGKDMMDGMTQWMKRFILEFQKIALPKAM